MIASNGKSRRPSKSKHFWWRSRFLIKLTINVPSATLRVKIFVSSLLHNKLKFTRKSGNAKKKWSTFSVSFLQMKQESPLLPVSHRTPAFRPNYTFIFFHLFIYSHKNHIYVAAHPKWSALRPFHKKA